jgi:hypothetical protein
MFQNLQNNLNQIKLPNVVGAVASFSASVVLTGCSTDLQQLQHPPNSQPDSAKRELINSQSQTYADEFIKSNSAFIPVNSNSTSVIRRAMAVVEKGEGAFFAANVLLGIDRHAKDGNCNVVLNYINRFNRSLDQNTTDTKLREETKNILNYLLTYTAYHGVYKNINKAGEVNSKESTHYFNNAIACINTLNNYDIKNLTDTAKYHTVPIVSVTTYSEGKASVSMNFYISPDLHEKIDNVVDNLPKS